MKNHRWSLLAFLAMGCGGAAPAPATPTSSAAPSLEAAESASKPELAAASTIQTEIPITSKSPQAIDEFKLARDLLENFRVVDAVPHLKKAIELDGDFAQAHAYAAFALPEKEGIVELGKAEEIGLSLRESERLHIEAMVAERRGDAAKVDELRRDLVKAVPGDWRAHWYLGTREAMQHHWDEATLELKRAVELNSKAGCVYNQLGYTYLVQGKKDEAVSAFKNYAEISPNEPNPHDSLADALLAANRLEEAEAEYRKALEASPQFSLSWGGIAATRALRGDWKGALDAQAAGVKAAPRPGDQFESMSMLAWTQFSGGKTAEALDTIKALEKQAEAQKHSASLAFGGLDRAAFFTEMGKPKDALKVLGDVTARADKDGLPGDALASVRRLALVLRATAQEKLGKKDDVAQTATALEADLKEHPAGTRGESFLEYVRGLATSAAGDPKEAAAHFDKCIAEQHYCKWRLVSALEKTGDKAAADAAKQAIADTPTRDTMYLYVRTKLGLIGKAK